MLENFGFLIVHKTLGFIRCSAVYVNAHLFVHIIHIINMYYEHYFYFAVNLLINTSCAFLFLPACLLAFFFVLLLGLRGKTCPGYVTRKTGLAP